MKKILLIVFLAMGSLFFLQSCSPYYYGNYYARPAPRVYVTPRPYYSPPPPPSYRHKRHYGRRYYRRY